MRAPQRGRGQIQPDNEVCEANTILVKVRSVLDDLLTQDIPV